MGDIQQAGVLVGRQAPDFCVPAVLGNGEIVDNFRLSDQISGKYGLVFFYPLDFTFVCPSEIIALDNRIEEFKKRQTEVIGVSIDSHFTHAAYRNQAVKEGGIGPVQFALASDLKHEITKSYGIAHVEAGVALRGAFIIDTKGIVRSQIVNDLPLGRNIDEIIRTIDALQFTEEHGEVCPAGWQQGDAAMSPTADGVASYLSSNSEKL